MDFEIIPQTFYTKNSTINIAKALLGKYLVKKTAESFLVGKIVESEAYLQNDPACHASSGKTKRTEPMFLEGGISYVYFIYGMYYCFNVVTQPAGIAEAVLIRAVEPVKGVDQMLMNRGGSQKIKNLENLSNGPGKLCQAYGIDKQHNKLPLYQDNDIFIARGEKGDSFDTVETTRIGINKAQDLPLRFYIKNNRFVSKV
jgi:DNA-3-methyladenine glycosylase